MKALLRKYLLQQVTLFAWLIVLLCLVMLYYVVIGVIILRENPEGLMAFLILPYLIPIIIVLGAIDYWFRQIFNNKLSIIWLVETILVLVFGAYYYHNHFYRTQFITASTTPLIILVKDPATGVEPQRGFIQLKTVFNVPADNILVLPSLLRDNEWARITAKTATGYHYRQIYPMQYMDKDTMGCGSNLYPIQFFQLESDAYPVFRIDEEKFDSIRKMVCRKIQKHP